MNHLLANEDCIKYLRQLEDNSVDLVLTDPPYFIGYDGGKGWDSSWKDEDDYLHWCKKWTKECERVLKQNRMLIVFGTLKTDTFLKYKLDVLNLNTCLSPQNEIIWSYNWGGRSKDNFARKHEYAWCYSKGKEFLFNADDIRVERKQKNNMNLQKKLLKEYKESNPNASKQQIADYRKEYIDPKTAFDKGTIPTCVWEKNNHTTSKEYVNWHPTQKPLEILQRMIKAYTNPGDIVLDIFSGSGSTMIAANLCDRLFLGCELDKEYYEKSLNRYGELVPSTLPIQ